MSEEKKEPPKEEETKETPPEETQEAKKSEPKEEQSAKEDKQEPEESKPKLEDLKFTEPPIKVFDNHVLLAHGANSKMIREVKETLAEFGLETVSTSTQEIEYKTLTDKSKEFANIPFAIVVLYTDIFNFTREQKPHEAIMKPDSKVVFELGFWIGKLGRDNVFVLHHNQKSFRLPTEYYEAVYTPFDKEGYWKRELRSRLIQCGLLSAPKPEAKEEEKENEEDSNEEK